MSSTEQAKIEIVAPSYLRNIIVIISELGLRYKKELLPMKKEQVDLDNGSPGSEYLFPTPAGKAQKPYMTNLRKVWAGTLKKAGLPYFAPYELRHTSATRLSAGGVADHMVTQMLRQSDADVFKRYSQAKLGMMREALAKLDRQASERGISSAELAN